MAGPAYVDAFRRIVIQPDNITVTADAVDDTLTLVAGSGISLVANASSDQITIVNTNPAQFSLGVAGDDSTIKVINSGETIRFAGTQNVTVSTDAEGKITITGPNLSGYLTSESDPVFTASAAAGITNTNISNWNEAYSWGDHAVAGYLTTIPNDVTIGSIRINTNVIQTVDSNADLELDANGTGAVSVVGNLKIEGRLATSSTKIALGESAGETNQGTQAIAIGRLAGQTNQGLRGIAIGHQAATSGQGQRGIAIGTAAAATNQGAFAIAMGQDCANTNQGTEAIAFGTNAGQINQGTYAIAIGNNASQSNQGLASVAVGASSGLTDQGIYAVALGALAANNYQGQYGVAIGYQAGNAYQGANAVAIGRQAGQTTQPANSIVINASGTQLDGNASGFFVDPIRQVAGGNFLTYNTSTKEITYTNTIGSNNINTNVIQTVDSNADLELDANGTGAIQLRSRLKLSDGTSPDGMWTNFTPTWTAGTSNPSIGNGILEGTYKRVGNTVHVWMMMTAGSTTTFGSGEYKISLPVTARAISRAVLNLVMNNDGTRLYNSLAHNGYTTTLSLDSDNVTLFWDTGVVTHNSPFAWASGDWFIISGTYEAS